RIKQYDFDISVEFEQFMKPSMLNKSKSISSTESEMVHWLEGLYKDLEIIDTLPDSLDVKAEYIECLDLTQAKIGRASCRERDWSSDVCSSDLELNSMISIYQ